MGGRYSCPAKPAFFVARGLMPKSSGSNRCRWKNGKRWRTKTMHPSWKKRLPRSFLLRRPPPLKGYRNCSIDSQDSWERSGDRRKRCSSFTSHRFTPIGHSQALIVSAPNNSTGARVTARRFLIYSGRSEARLIALDPVDAIVANPEMAATLGGIHGRVDSDRLVLV